MNIVIDILALMVAAALAIVVLYLIPKFIINVIRRYNHYSGPDWQYDWSWCTVIKYAWDDTWD